jgi:hypothetical protein
VKRTFDFDVSVFDALRKDRVRWPALVSILTHEERSALASILEGVPAVDVAVFNGVMHDDERLTAVFDLLTEDEGMAVAVLVQKFNVNPKTEGGRAS